LYKLLYKLLNMSCGLRSCRNKSKHAGVCGRHSEYRYLTDNKDLLDDMEEYKRVFGDYIKESDKLKDIGRNVLEVQIYFNNNLCSARQNAFPPELEKVGNLLEKQLALIKVMQGKHDDTLVYNMAVRICHSYGPKCDCSYCDLR
jgi:hypothetical protein